MSLNEIRCLPSCGSTNTYAKEHIEEFGPVAAVYTTSQTSAVKTICKARYFFGYALLTRYSDRCFLFCSLYAL